jgi:hypothetical protein
VKVINLLEVRPVVEDWQGKASLLQARSCFPDDQVLGVFGRERSLAVRYEIPGKECVKCC